LRPRALISGEMYAKRLPRSRQASEPLKELTTMKTVLFLFFVSACSMLPFPGSGGGQATHTSTSTSSTTEEVNGRPVSPEGEEDEDDDRGRGRGRDRDRDDDDDDNRSRSRSSKKKDGDIGKTCRKNHECDADACFVGSGNLGYCTKMCNSWSDCPSHWECAKPGNAPQRICMQDS
jgi:hypothetical protein